MHDIQRSTDRGRIFLQNLQEVIKDNKRALDDKEKELLLALEAVKEKRRAFERKCNDTFPELEQLEHAQCVTLTKQEVMLVTHESHSDSKDLLEQCRKMKREHETNKVYQRVGDMLLTNDSGISVALNSLWNATSHAIDDKSKRVKGNEKRVVFSEP